MSGNFFKPDIESTSTLSDGQQGIEALLARLLGGGLSGGGGFGGLQSELLTGGQFRGDVNRVIRQALRGKPTRGFSAKNTERVFRDSILDPALRSFDQEIAPRIGQSFAQHGASFSTRRGTETARQLGNLRSDAQGQLAQLVRQNEGIRASLSESAKARQLQAAGIPLQQTLGKIGGLGGLNQARFGPALSFLQNRFTSQFGQPGLGSQLLGLGGTLGGAALGGGFGGGGLFNKSGGGGR